MSMADNDKGEERSPSYSTAWKEAADEMKVDVGKGLSDEEVKKRRARYGSNEVPEKKVNPFVRFAKKFWGLTAWMLELTMIISLVLGKYLDLAIIGALLVFNSVLGFLQEQKASSAIEALKKRLQVYARVKRDGKWLELPSIEIVPGDVVRVRAGDFVPADLKIFSGRLGIDQSALTGESSVVEKGENDVVFSGSIVRRGEANSFVIATGQNTYYGRTAQLVQIAKPKLHMEEITSKVVSWLLAIVGTLLVIAIVISVARGVSILDILPLALVLLVSAIPVALPAMFTVSMALGSVELARKGVLVTRLSASEDAATMDTLCADKTGTITMNRLAITNLFPLDGFVGDDVVLYGALASNEANRDPIDIAFLNEAKKRMVHIGEYKQEKFTPFEPSTRRTEAVVRKGVRQVAVMKGAVRVIARLCGSSEEEIRKLEDSMTEFASKGYRTLAVAKRDVGDAKYTLVGLVALYDRPRHDSRVLIGKLEALGISVKMLTGDALPIAREIAKQVGLGDNIVPARLVKKYAMDDPAKAAEITANSDGFAEIYPEDKYAIVKSLQSNGHVVGMTGDGVNDAPALKQAEVGIAVSDATDVAKGAASVVLTGKGLSNIVDLVRLGRMIYQRIVTWVINKIIKTFEVVVFVTLSFIITGISSVGAFDIVLLLLVTDFVTLSLSTDRVRWSRMPDTWNIGALVKVAAFIGIMNIVEHFGMLYVGLTYFDIGYDIPAMHTFTFAMLFYSGAFTIFIVRERGHFWDSTPSRTLLSAILLDMLAVGILCALGIPGLAPIPPMHIFIIVIYYIVFILGINDGIKFMLIRSADIRW